MKRYVLAITGASGSVLGIRLLEELVREAEVHLLISRNTFPIIRCETGIDWADNTEQAIRTQFGTDRVYFFEDVQMNAPVASGSFRTDGMFVVPCSMKTLAGISCGYANNLIERAADVTMKEGRPLVLAPREMPFSAIHLENMLKLARIGVKIAPPVPAFYQEPKSLDQMVDFLVGKILDAMGIDHDLFRRWGA
ncbi:MAG TPA: flavin prenyltransferase UbiX [Dissulfurispiraceae bacterium]|nr:MAG: 3-octaprenyl-4-hydroxybenzoate carboxy-lyase UbiX [Nitrospirota bacterium]HSW63623.1 flavin prenyltransferase UbiX [Dissulfurispiraceae bacterium]